MNPSNAPLVDERIANLLAGGISICLASRGPGNQPNLSRALGCQVSADRRRLTLFVLASQSAALVRDVQANGALAAVFGQPSTHHSWQFKGNDARVAAPLPEDAERVAGYQRAFVAEVLPLGFPEPLVRTLLSFQAEDLLRLTFTPTSGFLQTPGRDAGKPLGSLP
jgi:hypothetical protein